MSVEEAQTYFDSLPVAKQHRYNLLVTIGLKLGKPTEGAYEYAKTIMESE